MSIDDATADDWDRLTRKTRKLNKDKTYGNDINSPVHYNRGNIECIDAIEAASTKEEFEGYVRANVLKYVWRFRYKDNIKDLRKAKWYLEKLISSVSIPGE